VPTGRYDAFVDARAGDRAQAGTIVDREGRAVASHDGVHRFTVGQRKNLGVALGERAYVVGLDPVNGTVQLGKREDLMQTETLLERVTLQPGLALPLRCQVAVRYRGTPVPARVEATKTGARVVFETPVQAVVPGQFAVFYDDDFVLGGGVIRGPSPAPGKRLPVVMEAMG
jgi:tRNA-specific 2-thiouridylase